MERSSRYVVCIVAMARIQKNDYVPMAVRGERSKGGGSEQEGLAPADGRNQWRRGVGKTNEMIKANATKRNKAGRGGEMITLNSRRIQKRKGKPEAQNRAFIFNKL